MASERGLLVDLRQHMPFEIACGFANLTAGRPVQRRECARMFSLLLLRVGVPRAAPLGRRLGFATLAALRGWRRRVVALGLAFGGNESGMIEVGGRGRGRC